MRARFLGFFLLAGLLTPPVVAQTVTPQPATTLDDISVFHVLPAASCFSFVDGSTVSTNGFEVLIDVVVVPNPNTFCGTVPPLSLTESLGRFAPGVYELSISGTVDGVPFGPDTTTFSVEPGPYGDLVSPIPTLAPWGLIALGLLVGAVALVRLRASG